MVASTSLPRAHNGLKNSWALGVDCQPPQFLLLELADFQMDASWHAWLISTDALTPTQMHCVLMMCCSWPVVVQRSSLQVALASFIALNPHYRKAQLHGTQTAAQHNYGEFQGAAYLA